MLTINDGIERLLDEAQARNSGEEVVVISKETTTSRMVTHDVKDVGVLTLRRQSADACPIIFIEREREQ